MVDKTDLLYICTFLTGCGEVDGPTTTGGAYFCPVDLFRGRGQIDKIVSKNTNLQYIQNDSSLLTSSTLTGTLYSIDGT